MFKSGAVRASRLCVGSVVNAAVSVSAGASDACVCVCYEQYFSGESLWPFEEQTGCTARWSELSGIVKAVVT